MRLVESMKVVLCEFGVRVMAVGKLRGFNMENDFGMSKFLFLNKGFDRLVVGATKGADDSTIIHEC